MERMSTRSGAITIEALESILDRKLKPLTQGAVAGGGGAGRAIALPIVKTRRKIGNLIFCRNFCGQVFPCIMLY